MGIVHTHSIQLNQGMEEPFLEWLTAMADSFVLILADCLAGARSQGSWFLSMWPHCGLLELPHSTTSWMF